MKRAFLSFVIVLAVATLSTAQTPNRFQEAKHGKGELFHDQGMPVVILRGKPSEIGEQFGILAVKNAPNIDELQKNFFKEAGIESQSFVLKLMARRFKTGIPADHLAEIEATVKVSGREMDLALFANTVYDLSSGMGCSTIVVEKGRSKTGSPIFGRNFDWLPSRGIHDHTLLAVFHPEGKRSFAILTVTPIIGCISGMNNAGLSCTINEIHLKQSHDSSEFDWSGIPTLLAFRRVLEECSTVAEAEKLLNSMKRTTTSCLTICDKNGGSVFEITPKKVVPRSAVNNVCLCTNHLRCEGLTKGQKCWRYQKLEPLQKEGEKIGVSDVFEGLDSVHQGKATLQSMVFEPAEKKLHLKWGSTTGSSSKLPAKTFDLAKWLEK